MEIAIFVVALVLIAGVAALRLGRPPVRAVRQPRSDDPVPAEARTAEPPGHVDDVG